MLSCVGPGCLCMLLMSVFVNRSLWSEFWHTRCRAGALPTPCHWGNVYQYQDCNKVEWCWWDSSLICKTNWSPSVLWHCWFGHMTCKNRPRYDVFGGTLNLAQSINKCQTLRGLLFLILDSPSWNIPRPSFSFDFDRQFFSQQMRC